MKRVGIIFGACLAALLLSFAYLGDTLNQQDPNEVTILAAASLADAVTEILKDAPEGLAVHTSFASTSTLAHQIQAGAKADIFISANALWMKSLRDQGHGTGAADIFAHNRLVLLAPRQSPLQPGDFQDLLMDTRVQRIALGDPASVPLGAYSKSILVHHDLWLPLQSRTLVYGQSATTVLHWVNRGEVDLAITYASDAFRADDVKVLATLPEGLNAITYWHLRLSDRSAVLDIESLLTSPRAKAHLSERGFHR